MVRPVSAVVALVELSPVQAVMDHDPLDRSVFALDRLRCRSTDTVVVGRVLHCVTHWHDVQHPDHTPPLPCPCSRSRPALPAPPADVGSAAGVDPGRSAVHELAVAPGACAHVAAEESVASGPVAWCSP